MSRRARVTPGQAGLYVRDDDVRRVPGLRREEVADLAGVSAAYYTSWSAATSTERPTAC